MSEDIRAHAQHPTAYDLSEEDYRRARDCMIDILRNNGWTITKDRDEKQFDNAFQHAVGIMSLTAARTPAASDIPERFKHEVAAIANELGMGHQDLTTGKIAEFARKLRAERDQAISQVERLPASVALVLSSERENRVKEQHKDVLPIYLYGFDDATEAALAALPHSSTNQHPAAAGLEDPRSAPAGDNNGSDRGPRSYTPHVREADHG